MQNSILETLETIQIVVLVLKVYGLIATPWVMIFLPVYLMALLTLIPVVISLIRNKRDGQT